MLAPDIDPVAISFPAFQLLGQTFQPAVHWYGLMYLVGFLGGWWLGAWRARRNPLWGWRSVEVSDLVFYVMLGVILGGRLGYVLFYDFAHYLHDPSDILRVWKGGMSFHGGLLGVLVAMWYYGRKTGRSFFAVTDFLAPLVPVGLGPGRIGNFINQELWGKVTDLPWGMIFKTGGPLPRHPSQLYEFALEGVVLFVILWLYSSKTRPTAAVSGVFLICYGAFRFLVEFVRQPDIQLGYLAFGWVTMGQILSLPMILFGAWLVWWAHHRNADQP